MKGVRQSSLAVSRLKVVCLGTLGCVYTCLDNSLLFSDCSTASYNGTTKQCTIAMDTDTLTSCHFEDDPSSKLLIPKKQVSYVLCIFPLFTTVSGLHQ